MVEILGVDLRASEVGGGFAGPVLFDRTGRPRPHQELLALGRREPLTLLLHGFNNSRSEGRRALLGFATLVEAITVGLDARLVAVLWPGDDLLSPLTYSLEERDADETAEHLMALCLKTWKLRQPLNLVAHSLGCRVALALLERLAGVGPGADQVLLMAGAVDADALARSDRYRRGVESARRVAVLHSRRDRVLQFAFPLGDALAAILLGGDTTAALGRVGPAPGRRREPVPELVEQLSLTRHGVGHGDYLPGAHVETAHRSAATYAGEQLRGDPTPRYP